MLKKNITLPHRLDNLFNEKIVQLLLLLSLPIVLLHSLFFLCFRGENMKTATTGAGVSVFGLNVLLLRLQLNFLISLFDHTPLSSFSCFILQDL